MKKNFKKGYGSFLWMGLNCLKAVTEPLRGDSLLFTSQCPEVSWSQEFLVVI